YSLFPIPHSLFPIPHSPFPIPHLPFPVLYLFVMEGVVEKAQVSPEPVVVQDGVEVVKEKSSIVKKFPGASSERKTTLLLVVGSLLVVLVGVASGWFLSGKTSPAGTSGISKESASKITQTETEAGMEDTSAFPDEVEGMLVEGGVGNEGTHHLERPGGESQNVYLTSTVIDLQGFVGKKVKIWGETLSGQSAGWLMDVGKIKVVE
ncbi:hypothetical protein KKB40_06025, partial [Patescibacteria group bacterium]|nr:hypothetical protein [Patescibacteria group bacterium]